MRIEKSEQKILESLEVFESFRITTDQGNFILDKDVLTIAANFIR